MFGVICSTRRYLIYNVNANIIPLCISCDYFIHVGEGEDEEPISDSLVFSRHDFDAGQWI